MRRLFLAAALGAAALAPTFPARADEPNKDLPKPPTTPLPDFENPLFDAQVGETLLYRVRELSGAWTRWFEERVLARTDKDILIETVETDSTGAKTFMVDPDPRNTGWRPLSKDMKVGSTQAWVKERQKDDVVYVGEPPTKAVRATRRVIEEPDPEKPNGGKRQREIWYSHDVPATGRVKMFPAQQGGERMALSWDKRLTAEECKKRAERYPKPGEEGAGKDPHGGMDEPGMDDPGMGEPGMDEPGMKEPGMGEPGMDDPGMGGDAGMGA